MNIGIYMEYTFEGDVFDLMGEEDLAILKECFDEINICPLNDVDGSMRISVMEVLSDIFSGTIIDPEEELKVGKGWKIVGGDHFMDDLAPMLAERFKEQDGLHVLCGCGGCGLHLAIESEVQ